MDKKFITAQEANEKAKAYSAIERIFQNLFRSYYSKRPGKIGNAWIYSDREPRWEVSY